MKRTGQMLLSDDAVVYVFSCNLSLSSIQEVTRVILTELKSICRDNRFLLRGCLYWQCKIFHKGALKPHWLPWVGLSSGLGLLSQYMFLLNQWLFLELTKMCCDLLFPDHQAITQITAGEKWQPAATLFKSLKTAILKTLDWLWFLSHRFLIMPPLYRSHLTVDILIFNTH